MTKKINLSYLFVILAIASILVIGASVPGCQTTKKTATFDTLALSFSFIPDAPPEQVEVQSAFPIYIEVKNFGGYDVMPGKAEFYLSGIGNSLTSVSKKETNKNILETKTDISLGGTERITFAKTAISSLPLQSPFPLSLVLTGCYDYQTIMQTDVCVGKKSNEICDLAGEKIESNQSTAAPIQITSLKEQLIGNKLQIIFLISNKATGEVYSPDSSCDKIQAGDIDEKLNQNNLWLTIETDPGFVCELKSKNVPYSSIKTTDGRGAVGAILCEKDVLSEETHVAPLKVTMHYKYKQSSTKQIMLLPMG